MQSMESGDSEDPVAYCWGCNTLILVPCIGGKPAELFKCGWCEAINDLTQQPLLRAVPQLQQPDWPAELPLQQQQPQQSQQPPNSDYQHQIDVQDYYTQQQRQWQQQQPWRPSVWQLGQDLPAAAASTSSSTANGHSKHAAAGWWAVALKLWRCIVVALVLLLVCSIAGCGVVTILPLVCTTWWTYLPNLAIALLLLFEILFNYAAAVIRPAGRVSEHTDPPLRSPNGSVAQGALQHWSWCRYCAAAKPPHAHHCKACGTCVVQMDHHCPFIANCVGRGNLRPFLLVLLWCLLAAAYILLMCALLIRGHWDEVAAAVATWRSSSSSGPGSGLGSMQAPPDMLWVADPAAGAAQVDSSSTGSWVAPGPPAGPSWWLIALTGVFYVVLQASPWWLLAAYYLVAVSLGVLIAVGMLLGSQLYYLGLGVSYIDSLKAAHAAGGGPQHAAGDVGERDGGRTQQLGRCRRWLAGVKEAGAMVEVVWARWWDVMGCTNPSACSRLWALVRPIWSQPTALTAKKWS